MAYYGKDDGMEKVLSYSIVFLAGFVLAFALFYQGAPVEQEKPSATLGASVLNASAKIFAIRSDNNQGVLNYVNIEIRPGRGRILMNTNPFIEPDTQYATESAVKYAENSTGVSMKDRDVLLSFDSSSQLVGGPSAGAATAIAVIAAIQNKTVRSDVAMTGTVDAAGRVGQVGGVLQKAEAAAKSGVKLFLVPKGEEILNYYEQQVTRQQVGAFVIQRVNYVPKTLDLDNYSSTQWGMRVRGVYTVEEALKEMVA